MTKEQKEKYDKIKATGKFTEEQLSRIKAGMEKGHRQYDIKKSKAHMDSVFNCLQLEKIDPAIVVGWDPEDESGDAYIYILLPNGYPVADPVKLILLNAMTSADNFTIVYFEKEDNKPETILIALAFTQIVKDPNRSSNNEYNLS